MMSNRKPLQGVFDNYDPSEVIGPKLNSLARIHGVSYAQGQARKLRDRMNKQTEQHRAIRARLVVSKWGVEV